MIDTTLRVAVVCVMMGSGVFSSTLLLAQTGEESNLPVKDPTSEGYSEVLFRGVRNMLSIDQIHSCITQGSKRGLVFDMKEVINLLNGSEIDPSQVYGRIYAGPFPFEASEADYTYHRFRTASKISRGKGTIMIDYLLRPAHNSEDWTTEGQVVARIELYLESEGEDQELGTYDIYVSFKKEDDIYVKMPSVIEGPFVNMLTSDDPTRAVISFRTNTDVRAEVVVNGDLAFSDPTPTRYHEIEVTGLTHGTDYGYYVRIGDTKSKDYSFRSAPLRGRGEISFAFVGDSREGVGGGEHRFMGINRKTLERITWLAHHKGADFFLVGGDLVSGYTTVTEDFRNQLFFWKQAASGFWHSRPIYPAIGNHEALLRTFTEGGSLVQMDRWPYGSESSEGVFAQEFTNPLNGPEPSDERRPSYRENVYSFQYGPAKIICFNNNYWVSYNSEEFGGSPEGYIIDDQLNWIKDELKAAEVDETVRYVILYAQEPVFPNGGHLRDAMWYHGDNSVRAYTYDSGSGELVPEVKGIIEVRNELVRAISECKKVAAVLTADEHGYHKVLIDRNVPVGDPETDDTDGNGRLGDAGDGLSPLADLEYPTWYITAGGGGAPYYSEEKTPWNDYWKSQPDSDKYYYSSQEHILLFTANEKRISLSVYNPYGEIFDRIKDLLAVK